MEYGCIQLWALMCSTLLCVCLGQDVGAYCASRSMHLGVGKPYLEHLSDTWVFPVEGRTQNLSCCGEGFDEITWYRGSEFIGTVHRGGRQPPRLPAGYRLEDGGQVLMWRAEHTGKPVEFSCQGLRDSRPVVKNSFKLSVSKGSCEFGGAVPPQFLTWYLEDECVPRAEDSTAEDSPAAEGSPARLEESSTKRQGSGKSAVLSCSAIFYHCSEFSPPGAIDWQTDEPGGKPVNQSDPAYNITVTKETKMLTDGTMQEVINSTLSVYGGELPRSFHCMLRDITQMGPAFHLVKSANATRCPQLMLPESLNLLLIVLPVTGALLVIAALFGLAFLFKLEIILFAKHHFPEWCSGNSREDSCAYDAFVAYAPVNEDEKIVYSYLRPFLEKENGFSLCLPGRDFTIGESIPKQIIEGVVRSSRSFIAILSPSFYEDCWCDFAVSIAIDNRIPIVFISPSSPSLLKLKPRIFQRQSSIGLGHIAVEIPEKAAFPEDSSKPLSINVALNQGVVNEAAEFSQQDAVTGQCNSPGSRSNDSTDTVPSACDSSASSSTISSVSSQSFHTVKKGKLSTHGNLRAARRVYPVLKVPSLALVQAGCENVRTLTVGDVGPKETRRKISFENKLIGAIGGYSRRRSLKRFVASSSQVPMDSSQYNDQV